MSGQAGSFSHEATDCRRTPPSRRMLRIFQKSLLKESYCFVRAIRQEGQSSAKDSDFRADPAPNTLQGFVNGVQAGIDLAALFIDDRLADQGPEIIGIAAVPGS